MRFPVLIFLLLTFTVSAQPIEDIKLELLKVQSLPEAYEYIRNNKNIIGDILSLASGIDTTALDIELLSTNKGDLIDFDSDDKKTHIFYKTIDIRYVNFYRLQYIYLHTWKQTVEQVDSIRSLILKRHGDGEPFDKLAREYSMDFNASKGGDRGWFEEGRMHADIESNIKKRKLNEVYIVDIRAYQWYYVIKHTHQPRVDKKIIVLQIETKN